MPNIKLTMQYQIPKFTYGHHSCKLLELHSLQVYYARVSSNILVGFDAGLPFNSMEAYLFDIS